MSLLMLENGGECQFRIAAQRRPMRIGIRQNWRREAIAVEMRVKEKR